MEKLLDNIIDDYTVYHNLQDYLLSRRYTIILNKYSHKELRRFYKDTIILLNYISSNNNKIHVGYEGIYIYENKDVK